MQSRYSSSFLVLSALLLVSSAPELLAQQLSSSQQLSVEQIVARMQSAMQRNHANMQPYTSTRRYLVFAKGTAKPRSEVIVNVSFLPPASKSYQIRQSTGGMGEHAVRKTLEKEIEASRNPDSIGVNAENYEFTLLGQEPMDGAPCIVLGLKPKHDSKSLIEGKAWVDARTFLIRRLEGELSQNPSFWVRDVHLTVTFGERQGMWLQTASRGTAHVRFVGDYSLISEDLRVVAGATLAENEQESRPSRLRRASTASFREQKNR
jgi:hypothetical protein